MTLSKESEDAFRRCLRILAPMHSAEERGVMTINVETYIAEGKWIPALTTKMIARLFYPNDGAAESGMLTNMNAAIEAKELLSSTNRKDSLLASDLAAWPDCPQVPQDSPLRFWLPEWMRETPQPATKPVVPAVTPGKPNKTEKTLVFDAEVLRLMTKFWNERNPDTKPTKGDLSEKVFNEMSRGTIRGARDFTESMVRDAAKPWRKPIVLPAYVPPASFGQKRHPFKGDQ